MKVFLSFSFKSFSFEPFSLSLSPYVAGMVAGALAGRDAATHAAELQVLHYVAGLLQANCLREF